MFLCMINRKFPFMCVCVVNVVFSFTSPEMRRVIHCVLVFVPMLACVCFVRPNNHSSSTSASWLTSLNHSIVTGSLWGRYSAPPDPSPLIFPETLILCLRSSTKRLTQRIAPNARCHLFGMWKKALGRCFLICRIDFSSMTNVLVLYLTPCSRRQTRWKFCRLEEKAARMCLPMCLQTFKTH